MFTSWFGQDSVHKGFKIMNLKVVFRVWVKRRAQTDRSCGNTRELAKISGSRRDISEIWKSGQHLSLGIQTRFTAVIPASLELNVFRRVRVDVGFGRHKRQKHDLFVSSNFTKQQKSRVKRARCSAQALATAFRLVPLACTGINGGVYTSHWPISMPGNLP